jgi:hypothetical protein
MPDDSRLIGLRLLETGALVGFQVVEEHLETCTDGVNLFTRLELVLGSDEEYEPDELVEWGAFGFIFALAALSFADARPRGFSDTDYIEEDEFSVADLFDGLRYVRGEIHFSADYLRGRLVKTDIIIRPNGTVTLTTRSRGKTAWRWLDRLKGKKHLEAV